MSARSRRQPQQQGGAQQHAVHRKHREPVLLDIAQQPLDHHKAGDGRRHEGHRHVSPVFGAETAFLVHLQQRVTAGRKHGRNAHHEHEIRRCRALAQAQQHGDEDRRGRARRTGKDTGHDLRQAHCNGHLPGHHIALGQLAGEVFGHQHPYPADQQCPGDGLERFGQLPAGLAHDQPDHRGDQEGHADLEHVVAVGALAQAGGQAPQALPQRQADGQDRASLDDDIEEVRTASEPLFGDQQVAGAGDRQEFGEAFENAQQQGGNQIGHRTGQG
ncbi:conserved hypothetical protein [Xanthomonas phaseoli pv. phaseoli]|nr:conserved hypothetical protein [Xanthomonas phaseoli pv. phaseoli]